MESKRGSRRCNLKGIHKSTRTSALQVHGLCPVTVQNTGAWEDFNEYLLNKYINKLNDY